MVQNIVARLGFSFICDGNYDSIMLSVLLLGIFIRLFKVLVLTVMDVILFPLHFLPSQSKANKRTNLKVWK